MVEENIMTKKYDSELESIPMIKLHPTYIPFIGDEYEKYRILHIAESHYINQSPENEKYSVEYFQKWWSEPCQEVFDDSPRWADTRQVMSNYMSGHKSKYTAYNNFIKSFSKIVLNKPITSISLESKQLYRYIAFMNFFQMPSLYSDMKYWNSLEKSSMKIGKPELAYNTWNEAVKYSIDTVDKVIDIINPRIIVITSISAGNAYKNGNGKYIKDPRVVYTSHPARPYSWNKSLKSLGGKKGIEVFEEALLRVYS